MIMCIIHVMNTKINYFILSIIQVFILSIFFTSSLFAHGGSGMAGLIIALGLIGFFVIAILFRIFSGNNTLLYVSLIFIAYFFGDGVINGKKHRFEINARHMFQTPNSYGVYEGNHTIHGTENLNIIYMANSSSQLPDILDDNKTIYIYSFQKEEIKHKIYVNELNKVTYFKQANGTSKFFMFEDKKNKYTSIITYTAIKDPREYSHDILNYIYDEEATTNYSDKLNRNLTSYEKIEFNDTKKLEKTFFERNPIVLIDKQNKQLRLFERNNREKFRPFSVPYTPRMALYSYNDIFVVYEEIKGLHVLKNIHTKEYTGIQNVVKQLINISVKSPEQLTSLKIHTLNTQQLNQLRNVLIRKPDIRYTYNIDIMNDEASINITSDSYPLLDITFILNKSSQWHVNNVLYSSQKRLNVLGSL